jgi:CelD/BcsL family acetyltransferase involved in cellulose biosynthesis
MVGSGTAAPDHLDLLVAGDEGDTAGAEVWAAVTVHRRWDVVHLDGLDANGRLAGIAATAPNSTPTPCPFLPLDGGWEAVELGFGSQLRKNLTRYGRKLERDAEVNVRLAADHDALDVAFDTLMRLHQSIRTAKGDPGVFARSDMRAFLRLATHRMLDAGHARLWSLEADGETIAAILCFLTGDVMSFYTTGYDEAWAKYGPGRRIMAEAVKGAIDEGASTFDFLRGDEAYKREWGTHDRFDTVVYQPVSWKGRASTMARHLVRTTRNALRSQP